MIENGDLHLSTSSFWKRLSARRQALMAIAILILIVLIAIFADFLAPYAYDDAVLSRMLQPPSQEFLLGTDELGRDVLSRMIYGSRASLLVGLSSVALSFVFGVFFGAIAGFYGGVLDYIIMGFIDIVWAFPISLLAMAVLAILGNSIENLIMVIAFVSWASFARMTRGEFMSLKNRDFILASRSLGIRNGKLITRHLLPHAIAPLIVLISAEIPKAIIIESTLSFLGLGLPPPTPSWGAIMNSGRSFITIAPWITLAPGIVVMLVVLCFNLLGDAIRDAQDPRLFEE